ncbi:MAG: hypothetical protein KDI71_12440 [Xanthomonadales bacterium]|nr:hypothetical protein [Xanthomonadales bacterium]
MFRKSLPFQLFAAAILFSAAANAERECDWNRSVIDPGSNSLILWNFRQNAVMDVGYCAQESDPDRDQMCRISVVIGNGGIDDEFVASDAGGVLGYSDKFRLDELGTTDIPVGYASFVMRRYVFSEVGTTVDFKIEQEGLDRRMRVDVGSGFGTDGLVLEALHIKEGATISLNFEAGGRSENLIFVTVDNPPERKVSYPLSIADTAVLKTVYQGRLSIVDTMPPAPEGLPNLTTISNLLGEPFIKP